MNNKRYLFRLGLMILLIVLMVMPLISLYRFGFDESRVEEHIAHVAKEQHPVGSDEIKRVRDYIENYLVSLEYEVNIIRLAIDGNPDNGYTENIIIKIPGDDANHGIAICGHYDSVPVSYGANDDGSAVVAMLETARLIKNMTFKQDVYFIFTDGEESGLLGSKALKENGYLKGIDYVFNFEARGASGSSLMFATSENNLNEVKLLSKANLYMRGNSIMSFACKMMPNYTEFRSFEEAGIRGFEYAYIGTGQYYHTSKDSFENFNMMGARQHAYYMYNTLTSFANRDNSDLPSEENGIYFSYLNHVIVFSNLQIMLLMMIAIIFMIWVIYKDYDNVRTISSWIISVIFNLLSMALIGSFVYILKSAILYLARILGVDTSVVLSEYVVHSNIIYYTIVVFVSSIFAGLLKKIMVKQIKNYNPRNGMSFILMIVSIVMVVKFPPLSFLGIFYLLPIIISTILEKYSKFWSNTFVLMVIPLLWPTLLSTYRAFGQVTWPIIGVVVTSWMLSFNYKTDCKFIKK